MNNIIFEVQNKNSSIALVHGVTKPIEISIINQNNNTLTKQLIHKFCKVLESKNLWGLRGEEAKEVLMLYKQSTDNYISIPLDYCDLQEVTSNEK